MIQVNPGPVQMDVAPLLESAVREVLASQEANVLEVSVTLLSDDAIRELNRTYLSHDHVTDVLSFPLETPAGELMGDIYLGAEQAGRQAEGAGVTLDEELVRLTVHGTLHVLGFEHPEGDDRSDSEMYRLQEALVTRVMSRSD